MESQRLNAAALVGIQANELNKLIDILQGLAADRSNTTPTQVPTTPAPPAQTLRETLIYVAASGKEEAILWEQVGTGQVLPPEAPITGLPSDGGANTITPPLPPLAPQRQGQTGQPTSTLEGICTNQRR